MICLKAVVFTVNGEITNYFISSRVKARNKELALDAVGHKHGK
jgi:hypothetical protein